MDSENQNNNFVESSNLIFTKTEINNLDGIVFLADDIALNDENFKYLYWTDDKKVFRKANDSSEYSELGITNGDKEISVNMPLNSDITLDLNDNSVKADLKNTSDYSITYCSVEENESIKSTAISGNTSEEILVQQTEDGIIVNADSLLEVKVSTENHDNINEVTFTSSQNSILIKDEDGIRIYEDGNNDGTYEKEIASSNENVEKLSLPKSNYESGSSVRQGTLITLLSEENTKIYYTIDGTTPTTNSLLYSEPIVVNTDITIQAIAVKKGYKNSDIATFVYTITQGQCYTVTFNSNGGTYISTQTVQENEKASEPTAPIKERYIFTGWYLNGILYNFDTEVVSDIILEAGWTEEGKTAAPTSSIASGSTVESGTSIKLISSEGAQIYYTLDETIPTISSILFTEDILITQNTIIKAFAVQEGLEDSDVATFIYNISTTENPDDLGDILPEDIPESGIPNGLWIAGIKDMEYTGKAIKPLVRVYDYKTKLTEKQDYTISYKNNINVNDAANESKAPSVVIQAKGNYSGKETATFKILAKDIDSTDFDIADITVNPNKKVQKPVPAVIFKGKHLSNKKDFTVTYPDTFTGAYKEKGTYSIKIFGKGNYTGERTINFVITDNNLITKAKISKISSQQYTGKALTPTIQVKYGKTTLKEGKDYELAYRDNTEIGTATVIVKGKGDYSGQKTISFKIIGASINKGTVVGLNTPSTFNGSEITKNFYLVVIVNGNQRTLKEGQDYTVKYQNNKKAGNATLILTGINGYSGTLKKTFKINAYDLQTDADKKVCYNQNLSVAYAKNGSCPDPVIYFDGTKLEKGKDYNLSYKNNKAVNAGGNSATAPTIIVKGKGNFTGTLPITFAITSQDLSNLTLTANDKAYKNRANIFATSIKIADINGKTLSAGKDYDKNSIVYTYVDDVKLDNGVTKKAGDNVEKTDIIPADTQIQVSVTAKAGGYYKGTAKGVYRIIKSDIKNAKISIPAQTYTGKAIVPAKSDITITVGGTKLAESEFEIVSCTNNMKKGKASITIKGKGNYGGTKTIKFTIKSKGFLWWWRK